MSKVIVLFVTIPEPQADAFVQQLCRERLVACGNILPGARSHYWWQGELCHETEAVVLLETAADRLSVVMERAASIHPYQTPKIIAISPGLVHSTYETWVLDETRSEDPEPAPDPE